MQARQLVNQYFDIPFVSHNYMKAYTVHRLISICIRKTIERSQERFKFVSKIGRFKTDNEKESIAKGIMQRSAEIMETDTGI